MIGARKTLIFYCKRRSKRFNECHARDIPLIFFALLAAEDHRAAHHRGIDWISILRGFREMPRGGAFRGISTIEQQFVRTVFPRRGVARWIRKGPEIVLARWLAYHIDKASIWAAYLSCAYYGRDYISYSEIRSRFNAPYAQLSERAAAQIVSCLKYPAPHWPHDAWRAKHERRTRYVLRRMRELKLRRSGFFGLAPAGASPLRDERR